MGTLKSHALPDVAAQAPRVATPRGRPLRKRWPLAAWIALVPMLLTVLFAYLGTMLWTARVSLSNSRTFRRATSRGSRNTCGCFITTAGWCRCSTSCFTAGALSSRAS